MKRSSWQMVLLLAFFIAVASIAPFLPGPGNRISHGLSQFVQILGYIGLPFVPFGLVWLIIEIRNRKGHQLNRWTNGYFPAWLAMIPVFLFLPIQIARTIFQGENLNILPFAVIITIAGYVIYRIQKLKIKSDYNFNPAPVYIVLIPVIAMLSSKFAVEKAAVFTREKAITNTEPLIAAIEKYRTENGEYPESLGSLIGRYIKEIPRVRVMAMRDYQYEKRGSSFQLSFERIWHWNATEVVTYNTLGQKGIIGDYGYHPTKHENWWYHMAD